MKSKEAKNLFNDLLEQAHWEVCAFFYRRTLGLGEWIWTEWRRWWDTGEW